MYRPLPTPTAGATRIVMALHGAQAPARPGPLAAPTGRSPASHGIRIEASARIRRARMARGLAGFLPPACLIGTALGMGSFVALIVTEILCAERKRGVKGKSVRVR